MLIVPIAISTFNFPFASAFEVKLKAMAVLLLTYHSDCFTAFTAFSPPMATM
jgi:hypothetical protein